MTTNKYHVFVYGTLRQGESNWAWALKDKAKFLGSAVTKGRLYHLGGFPGFRFSQDNDDFDVYGEVFEVDDATLKVLDRLEGVDHGFYNREQVLVTYLNDKVEDDAPTKVYIYVYGNQPKEHNLIRSGDWLYPTKE